MKRWMWRASWFPSALGIFIILASALEADAVTVLRGGVDKNRLLGQRAAGYRHPAGHLPCVVPDSTNGGARDGAAHGISRRRDRIVCPDARTVSRAGSPHDVPAALAGTLPARGPSSGAASVPPVGAAADHVTCHLPRLVCISRYDFSFSRQNSSMRKRKGLTRALVL